MCEPLRNQLRLTIAKLGQRRVLTALESAFGDERRFAVTNQDESRNEIWRQR
jgi:hypothetical protein